MCRTYYSRVPFSIANFITSGNGISLLNLPEIPPIIPHGDDNIINETCDCLANAGVGISDLLGGNASFCYVVGSSLNVCRDTQ